MSPRHINVVGLDLLPHKDLGALKALLRGMKRVVISDKLNVVSQKSRKKFEW